MYEIYCKLRDERGLKDADVVRQTGITKSTFSDWKSGRSKPKNEKLQKVIPDNTKINNVELKGDILYIDFSHEFIDNALEGKENESKIIETIVKTVTELNEINAIKILIDGEENKCFKDEEINFEKEFLREDY